MTLADHLAKAAATPFCWGSHDCCLWVADWLVANGYCDPAAAYRGRYRTALGAARILNKSGGVLGICASQAASARLKVTEAPAGGDVGVVMVRDADGRKKPAAAICAGARWAVLGAEGVLLGPTTPLAAWRV